MIALKLSSPVTIEQIGKQNTALIKPHTSAFIFCISLIYLSVKINLYYVYIQTPVIKQIWTEFPVACILNEQWPHLPTSDISGTVAV